MPDLVDNITDWLLDQALGEDDMAITLGGLAKRLQNGGIPITRVSMGRSVLHPVIALIDIQWQSDTGLVQLQSVPRNLLNPETMRVTPFGDLTFGKVDRIVADLKNPDDVKRYELFQEMANEGLNGYVAFVRHFGRDLALFPGLATQFGWACVSFATRRFSGFSKADTDVLERLVPALCVCARVDNDRFLAKEILQAYLGRITSDLVLSGEVGLGHGQQIDCAIFYSDLCGSVALSQELDTQAYLDAVNSYFECTVNAVSDHGGEVLKLIGDGVLAIFPFDENTRLRENMCAAALASAREAFARAAIVNETRSRDELPVLKFGVGLHVGKVIYGNVGTEKRLDFTATGPAVGLAARIEALTRVLDAPVLATKDFADFCLDESTSEPAQSIKDFADQIELVRYDV
jgi:adenylate cyclase